MPKNNPASIAHLRTPDYSGSWFSQHLDFPTTLPIAKYVPVTVMDIPAHTLNKFKPSIRFDSVPMISPLYQGFTMRTKFYFAPYRNYIANLRRNIQMDWGVVDKQKLPYMEFLTAPSDFSTATEALVSLNGSLLERLGIFNGESLRQTNINSKSFEQIFSPNGQISMRGRASILPLLVYIDTWLRGEYNPQDKNIPYTRDSIQYDYDDALFTRITSTQYISYSLLRDFVDVFAGFVSPNQFVATYSDFITDSAEFVKGSGVNIDNVVGLLAILNSVGSPFSQFFFTNYSTFRAPAGVATPSLFAHWSDKDNWAYVRNNVSVQGLLPVTYKGDYFKSWFAEDGVNILRDYVLDNNESFLTLRRRNAEFMVDMMALVSGNRYVDYLQFVFDTELELKDHPILVGYDEIDFGSVNIQSNADTSESQGGYSGYLGSVASRAWEYNDKVKTISFKTLEPGMFMACTSIIPNIVYMRTAQRFHFYENFADLWHPSYSGTGFQSTFLGEHVQIFGSPNQTLYGTNTGAVTGLKRGLDFVPVGWEYMKRYGYITGGLKCDNYQPWTLAFDPLVYSRQIEGDDSLHSIFPEYIRPLYDEIWYNDTLNSTYIRTGDYNYVFTKSSRIDNENFVFQISYDYSCYMPMTKQLISKHF